VESFFDGLNDQFASALPGRTFRSWVERADYRPDDGPLITYEALLEVIHIHRVDVYAASKHPTASGTRREMWQESAAQFPPCIPATPDELLVLLSKRADRTLSPRGIELGGMFYTSDELTSARRASWTTIVACIRRARPTRPTANQFSRLPCSPMPAT